VKAAFAKPEIYEKSEERGVEYAIRIQAVSWKTARRASKVGVYWLVAGKGRRKSSLRGSL
jgi:hypothetical protein